MRQILLSILVLLSLAACQESNFNLSPESRIPKWFVLPEGVKREDVSVSLTYYLVPTEKSVFELRYKNGKFISKVVAHRYGGYLYPKGIKTSHNGYPSYEVLTSNNVIDIIEHRKMEPIFYTTDDPSVWAELGATK